MVQLHQAAPLVERQHALVEEMRLNTPAYTPTQVLAVRTGVSNRTIERDIARLVEAGLPIDRRRGPGGGYRLDVTSEPDPIHLNCSEIACVIASLVSLGPYSSASTRSTLDKLLGALTARASERPLADGARDQDSPDQ